MTTTRKLFGFAVILLVTFTAAFATGSSFDTLREPDDHRMADDHRMTTDTDH